MRSCINRLAACVLGWAVASAFAQVSYPAVAEHALARLRAETPQVLVRTDNGMVSRVGGVSLARGDSPFQAAERFRTERAEVFSVPVEDLVAAPLAPGGRVEQPVMYDRQTGAYRFTLVRYQQQRGGIPVFGSDLRLLIRNDGDFPLVLAASALRNLGDFAVDRAVAAKPFIRLEQIAPDMTNYSAPEVVIWAGIEDMRVDPVLAITFTADNYDNPDVVRERWMYVADAATGAVLHRANLIHHAAITGSVQGKASAGPKADFCAEEVETAMPWARVYAEEVGTGYTDADGAFSIPYEGETAVTVYSYMDGTYFRIENAAGAEETLSAEVTPGQPYTFTHNADNTSELIRSQVNCYVAANQVRDWVLAQNPEFPGIFDQEQMLIYVNRSDASICPCNAWCDGVSLYFCRAGAEAPPSEVECPNFGWSNILHHEYAHYVIYCADGGAGVDQGQYGEGMSDSFAVLLADEPGAGYGYHMDCEEYGRTADNDFQYPCLGEIHDCGPLLSGCIWDIREELILTKPPHPTEPDYLDILSDLAVNSILLHSGATITPQIAIDFLTLDDTDEYLVNGTPHWDEICTGFSAHGMGCPALGTGLFVHPEGGLASVGSVGGPFDPLEITYTLENLNGTPISYTVAKSQTWVLLSTIGGTLGAHQTVDVTVSIDSAWAARQEMGRYTATVTFTNTTDHDGDTTRPVELTIPAKRFTFDGNPPWTTQGQWAFGDPQGGGGVEHGYPDPDAGATGSNVYGVNLSGDYSTTPGGPYYLTTGAIPLGDTVNRQLRFKRWLNTDHLPYASATVEASINGLNWTQLWTNGTLAITEDEWSTQTYDLTGVVGNQNRVYVRWGYRIYAGAWAYSGWNIDDVEFLAEPR